MGNETRWKSPDSDLLAMMVFQEAASQGFVDTNKEYMFAERPNGGIERQREYEEFKALLGDDYPELVEDLRDPDPLIGLPLDVQSASYATFLEPPYVSPVVFAPKCNQMFQVHAEGDRHLTTDTSHFESVLTEIDLRGMNILEIGYGTGLLTEVVFRQNIGRYVGFDINEPSADDMPAGLLDQKNAEFLVQDFQEADFSFMKDGSWAVVSNPPYFLIPKIKETIINPYQPDGVVLITSQKHAANFPDYTVDTVQDGMGFTPPATGLHFVISHGFDGRWSPESQLSRADKPVIKGEGFDDCPTNRQTHGHLDHFSM